MCKAIFFKKNIIEITGPPGSGKTTYIESSFPGANVLLGALPLSYGTARRIFGSFFSAVYSVIFGIIRINQMKWLISRAMRYDETWFCRVNAFRNCMTKFGYARFCTKDKSTVVDEGISHIPFVLGLSSPDIDEFLVLFRQHLQGKKIIFIEAPPKEVLLHRIRTRGHKRVRNESEAEGFVDKQMMIATYYRHALLNAGLDVEFV